MLACTQTSKAFPQLERRRNRILCQLSGLFGEWSTWLVVISIDYQLTRGLSISTFLSSALWRQIGRSSLRFLCGIMKRKDKFANIFWSVHCMVNEQCNQYLLKVYLTWNIIAHIWGFWKTNPSQNSSEECLQVFILKCTWYFGLVWNWSNIRSTKNDNTLILVLYKIRRSYVLAIFSSLHHTVLKAKDLVLELCSIQK